jgi:hypothetical protein
MKYKQSNSKACAWYYSVLLICLPVPHKTDFVKNVKLFFISLGLLLSSEPLVGLA